MEQTTGTTSDAAATAPAAPSEDHAAPPAGAEPAPPDATGFGARGRIRRRARFLRKARELAYRDLGGLVYNLHRFGQRNDQLVLAKLNLLGRIDHELRTLEGALDERRPMTILREAGVTVCARCAAIHSSEDRYCPNCGLSLGRHPDLPIAGAPAGATTPAPPAPAASPAPGASPAPAAPTASPAQPPDPVPEAPGPPAPPASAPAPTASPAAMPAAAVQPAGPPTQPHPAPAASREEDTEIIRPPASGP